MATNDEIEAAKVIMEAKAKRLKELRASITAHLQHVMGDLREAKSLAVGDAGRHLSLIGTKAEEALLWNCAEFALRTP